MAPPTKAWTDLPAGLYLVFEYRELDGLFAVSVPDGRVTKILDGGVYSAALMGDKKLAVISGVTEPQTVDLYDGEMAAIEAPREVDNPFQVAFSPTSADVIWVAGYPQHNLPINGDGSFLYYYHSGSHFGFMTQGGSPVWSPDGRYVAYEKESYLSLPASMPLPTSDIALLDVACIATRSGQCSERILTSSTTEAEARKPTWAPDSQSLAYECSVRDQDGGRLTQEICIIALDGSVPRKVSADGAIFEQSPVWSPRGDYIAVGGQVSRQNAADLYLIDVRTGSLTNITDTASLGETPLFWWNKDE